MIKLHVKRWLLHRRFWLSRLNRKTMWQRVVRLLILFLLVILTHIVAMVFFEEMSFWQAFWVTIVSVTTIGYGDISAATPIGQAFTLLLICFLGIWIMAQLVGEWVDYRLQRREQMLCGDWEWPMLKDHLVIINAPQSDSTVYLKRLVSQIRYTPKFSSEQIVLLTDIYSDGLPSQLQELDVLYIREEPESSIGLQRAWVEHAKYIIVIAENSIKQVSDSITFDILDRLKQINSYAKIVVESVLDENRRRFYTLGAAAVIRPIRAYPEMTVRALAAPGVEQIMENLFTHRGDSTWRYDISISQLTWKEIVLPLLDANYGTPLGYMDPSGLVHTNPKANDLVDAKAIFILIRDDSIPTDAQIQHTLSSICTEV